MHLFLFYRLFKQAGRKFVCQKVIIYAIFSRPESFCAIYPAIRKVFDFSASAMSVQFDFFSALSNKKLTKNVLQRKKIYFCRGQVDMFWTVIYPILPYLGLYSHTLILVVYEPTPGKVLQ